MSTLPSDLLANLRVEHGLACFCETGCYMGDGIATALSAGFETVRSCDISAEHVARSGDRFAADSRVKIVLGESVEALAEMLQEDHGPTLFWLDAHYPAFYGLDDLETEVTKYPVPQELALIHRIRGGAANDVILIDDLRVVESADNPRWRGGENPEYFIVRGLSLASLTEAFADTHEWRVDVGQDGILVLTPRRS